MRREGGCGPPGFAHLKCMKEKEIEEEFLVQQISKTMTLGLVPKNHNCVCAGAMNYKSLEVYKKPNIGVIANGNELFEPGGINQQIKQPASTKASIISLINAWGGKAIDLGIAKDTLNSLKISRYLPKQK